MQPVGARSRNWDHNFWDAKISIGNETWLSFIVAVCSLDDKKTGRGLKLVSLGWSGPSGLLSDYFSLQFAETAE